ncbi:hypothetical protein EBQ74_10210 [bacterium]|nr:hypothetical protein [bacterium]
MGLAFRKPIEKALQNRLNSLRLFQEEKTDCYRLFNGTGRESQVLLWNDTILYLSFNFMKANVH